jgi:hypothetical protein
MVDQGARETGGLRCNPAATPVHLWNVCARRIGSKSSALITQPSRHSSEPMAHSMWMSSGDPA